MTAKTVDDAVRKMEENIAEKTGKPFAHWVATARASGFGKHGQIVKFLKTEHGFTHGYANLVANRALQPDEGAPAEDDLVEAQYAGPKAGLKPIYEAIMGLVETFGPGLEVAPKKTYVSLRHKKQFALVQPSTKTRVDLGINLKGKAPAGKLEASGSFNQMVSHRVRLEAPADIDADVQRWLREAFEAAG